MTLAASFYWKHPDSTSSLNNRLYRLANKGIFYGGTVSPGTGLTVTVSPFMALSYDGMTVVDDETQTLAVVAGQTNYVVVRAKYNAYGSPATPTLSWEVLEQSVYNADPEKDYLIVFCVVTLASGSVSVSNSDISLLDRNEIDQIDRSFIRGNIASSSSLPPNTPKQNRVGDIYFVQADETFYWWDGASWTPFTTGSYNTETENMNRVLITEERDRRENGSGVIAGSLDTGSKGLSSSLQIGIIETPTVANQIGIDSFSAIVNGHYVQTYARNITLPSAPSSGTRFDLIFLEVWREEITVPENWNYPRNPDGSLSYNISQISDLIESMGWQDGTGGDNFDLNEIQVDDHKWVVTKYRFSYIENVPSQVLYDDTVAAPAATNIDGNTFTSPYGASSYEYRTWGASSTTAKDGISWAIPILAVKRTSTEDYTTGNGIKEFRDDERYVFPIYPVADTGNTARNIIDIVENEQDLNRTKETKPSGFLSGLDYQITGTSSNKLSLSNSSYLHVRIRGVEDKVGLWEIDLGTPPSTGYERILVYLKMKQVLYPDNANSTRYISDVHTPITNFFAGFGVKKAYTVFELVAHSLGSTATELDEHDAMTSAGWSKGDLSVSTADRYLDGGLWSKQYTNYDDDESIPILKTEWAIPIALIHRRNSTAWDYATNPNGSGSSRPDDRTDATVIHPDDLVDLRHMVDVDPGTLHNILENDINKLLRGELRTRMAEKWAGAGTGGEVAGSRILQSDMVDVTGGSAAFSLAAPDGTRTIWSDAKEFMSVCESFTTGSDYSGTLVTWTEATGTLTINAPNGAHIVTHMPASIMLDGEPTSGTYLDYYTSPCWTTKSSATPFEPYPSSLRAISTSDSIERDFFDDPTVPVFSNPEDPKFTVTSTDGIGRPVQMQFVMSSTRTSKTHDIAVSFWVHYDRSFAGRYATNYGLAEVPDVVHSATLGPNTGTPTTLNIGPLYTSVRKTLSSSSSIIISSSDILSASGTPGTTAYIVGIIDVKFDGTSAGVTSTQLASGRTSITITLSSAITTEVEVTLAYYTDEVSQWIEVSRGGKSIRGIFSWEEVDLDFSASGPPTDYSFIVGSGRDYWYLPTIGTNAKRDNSLFIWTGTSASGPWTGRTIFSSPNVGHPLSNIFTYNPNDVDASDTYHHLVYAKCSPPVATTAGEILIHYTYTPYQGLSGNGAKADITTAVVKLKKMLHGTVTANTDFVVTQTGPSSIFGGVDVYTGESARGEYHLYSRPIDWYNNSILVKPKSDLTGLVESGGIDPGFAAGTMRLPLPLTSNMTSASTDIVLYVSDWDLDPDRKGANTGFGSIAPTYAIAPTLSGINYSQFVNGLTPITGEEAYEENQSRLIPRVFLTPIELSTITSNSISAVTKYWSVSPTETANLSFGSITSSETLVTAVAVGIDNIATTDSIYIEALIDVGTYPTFGKYDSSWDIDESHYSRKIAPDGTKNFVFYLSTGSILKYITQKEQDDYAKMASVLSTLKIDRGSTSTGSSITIGSPLVIATRDKEAPIYSEARYFADTIIVPLDSGVSISNNTYESILVSGKTSLIGTKISYPDNWSSSAISKLENLYTAAEYISSGYGRGVFLSDDSTSPSYIFNMPVLIPGSGTPLNTICYSSTLLLDDKTEAPIKMPVAPAKRTFVSSVKRNTIADPGGPIAYCFYGININPEDNDYKNMITMQISGGIIDGVNITGTVNAPQGTALDAFWPSNRPILSPKYHK